jgi:hypothetical protein
LTGLEAKSVSRHRGRLQLAGALLLPATWPGRICFFSLGALPWILALPAAVFTVLAPVDLCAFVVGAVLFIYRRRHRALAFVAAALLLVIVDAGTWLLSYLALGGSGLLLRTAAPGAVVVTQAEESLAMVAAWLLLGVPHRAYTLRLDAGGTGSSQRILVILLSTAACALSALYVLALHFGGGPLRDVHLSLLLVGVALMVVLIAPYYRATAQAIWRHGIFGVAAGYRSLRRTWRSALVELRQAVDASKAAAHAPQDTDLLSDSHSHEVDTQPPAAPDAS